MRIGYAHADRLLRYPHPRNLSASPNGTYATLHPISGTTPDQWQCTRSEEVQCLRIGCSAPINKNKRGIYRSIDATTTSKLHAGRRRVELNREISRRDAQSSGNVGQHQLSAGAQACRSTPHRNPLQLGALKAEDIEELARTIR